MNKVERIICFVILLLIIIFIFMVIKVSSSNKDVSSNRIKYEIIDDNTYGRMYMRGYYIERVNDGIDIIIGLGSKNTGGYSLTLDKIVTEEDVVVIYVNETSPKPSDIVTEAFTYPTLKLKVNINIDNIRVINQYGVEFNKLN